MTWASNRRYIWVYHVFMWIFFLYSQTQERWPPSPIDVVLKKRLNSPWQWWTKLYLFEHTMILFLNGVSLRQCCITMLNVGTNAHYSKRTAWKEETFLVDWVSLILFLLLCERFFFYHIWIISQHNQLTFKLACSLVASSQSKIEYKAIKKIIKEYSVCLMVEIVIVNDPPPPYCGHARLKTAGFFFFFFQKFGLLPASKRSDRQLWSTHFVQCG